MKMFKNKTIVELEATISCLKLEIETLKRVHKVELDLYKDRGDRYLTALDEKREDASSILKMAKEIMVELAKKAPVIHKENK